MPRGLVHVAESERCVLSHAGSPHHRRFLRFAFEGVAYQYKALPFGLSLATRTFTRCMDAALSPLQQMGIRIVNYLDDWLILAQSQAVLTLHKTLLLSHLGCLGLRVNFAKSILSPSQQVSFLGTVIDSVQMTATVSAERATTIQYHMASFEEGTNRPLKAFQRMLGLMASALPVLRLGLLHMRPIQFLMKQRVPSAAWRHRRHHVGVTRACVSGLACWRDLFWLKQWVILDTVHRRLSWQTLPTRLREHCAKANRPSESVNSSYQTYGDTMC